MLPPSKLIWQRGFSEDLGSAATEEFRHDHGFCGALVDGHVSFRHALGIVSGSGSFRGKMQADGSLTNFPRIPCALVVRRRRPAGKGSHCCARTEGTPDQ